MPQYLRAALLLVAVALMPCSTVLAQVKEKDTPPGSEAVNVFNPIEGRATVLSAKSEGSRVKKGELVCELDASPLKERLANQEITILGAESGHQGALLARQIAEIAIEEYEKGTFLLQLETARGEVALAESDFKRAEDRLAWSDRMLTKGGASVAENMADKLSLQKARLALEQAQSQKLVLEKYTRPKTMMELDSQVRQRKSQELREQAAQEREQAKGKWLLRQINRCKVLAPADGRVTFTRPFGASAVVIDGELLFRIIPEGGPEPRAK